MAARYPGHIAMAAVALFMASAATLAIPAGFKLVIDRGFAANGGDIGRWFQYLLLIVLVLAIATATRFILSPGLVSAWWRICAWPRRPICCGRNPPFSNIIARPRSPRA